MSLAPGTRLGPYEIRAIIGSDSMGDVYRARDTRLDRTVAIKVVRGEFTERGEGCRQSRRGRTNQPQKWRAKVRKRREENVFDQLGFSREEAIALAMKADLHRKIIRCAKNRNYSQAQLVKILHEPQPRVSDLLRGKIAKFSLEALVNYAEALDMRPEIRVHEPVLTLAARRALSA